MTEIFIITNKIKYDEVKDPFCVNIWQEEIWKKLSNINELKIHCIGRNNYIMEVFVQRWVHERKVLECVIKKDVKSINKKTGFEGLVTEYNLRKKDWLWNRSL